MTQNGRLKVVNPATGEGIEEIETTSREDLDKVAHRARRGFKEWREVSGLERAELFHEIAGNLRGHADELAEIMTKEGGKPSRATLSVTSPLLSKPSSSLSSSRSPSAPLRA
jgi:acyl-CoA reductase-like NAD-dependent aldehyde dehydrogenase